MQSFRQFSDSLVDDADSDTAEERFDEYKAQWDVEAGAAYFKAHHFEEWLRQRYHPRESAAVRASLRLRSQAEAASLHASLLSGLSSDVVDSLPATLLKQAQLGLPTSSDQLWTFIDPRCTLMLTATGLPCFASEADLLPVLSPLPGFKQLLLSDPTLRHNKYGCVAVEGSSRRMPALFVVRACCGCAVIVCPCFAEWGDNQAAAIGVGSVREPGHGCWREGEAELPQRVARPRPRRDEPAD